MKYKYSICFAALLLVMASWLGCSNSSFEEEETFVEDIDLPIESSDDNGMTDSRDSSDVDSVKTDSLSSDSLCEDTLDVDSIDVDTASSADLISGFVKFSGAKSVTLKDASYGNDVSMEVKLSYDFFMARSEVTMGEYAKLMGGKVPESQKNLPQVEVNYYDAVLFANAKSKSEGLDTVYTYISSQMSPSGNCFYLEGLTVRYDVYGYRLPTEAEWTYVAQNFWDVKKSWTADNSSYEIHQVCTEPSSSDSSVKAIDNADVVCDMAGNVTEWVDGWLVDYKDTSLTNFVGGGGSKQFRRKRYQGWELSFATGRNQYRQSQGCVSCGNVLDGGLRRVQARDRENQESPLARCFGKGKNRTCQFTGFA